MSSVNMSRFQALSAKGYYDEALAIAQEWQADAYLQFADLTVRSEDGMPHKLWLSFIFYSVDLHNEALLVFFVEGSPVESKIVRSGSGDRREIEEKDWALDGIEALKIAQGQGGNEYMSKYSGVEIKLFLEHQKGIPESSLVVWRVSYLRPEGVLYIVVDAVSGEVVEIIE
ncbi:MAG: PepSY domain-containing protein [Anaerolineales bacterium]|nr:PepSY domain-containing protein [Anaerolineales bacterium]